MAHPYFEVKKMKDKLLLFKCDLSANARKVSMLAELLELDAKVFEINVYRGKGQSPEFLKINPLGKIPTLK